MEDLSGIRTGFTSEQESAFQYGMNIQQYIQAIQGNWAQAKRNGEKELHVIVFNDYVVDLNEIFPKVCPWAAISWSLAPKTDTFHDAENYRVLHIKEIM